MSKKFLQSHVYGDYGSFFVSTCYRESSAAIESPPWYYETFAWRLDKKDAELNGTLSKWKVSMNVIEKLNVEIAKSQERVAALEAEITAPRQAEGK